MANSAALDFETTTGFSLTVAAIDAEGAYGTATVTIDLSNVDEAGTNDAPENSVPADQVIDKDGMLLFSSVTGTAIAISDFDAGGSPVEVTLTATNGTLNLSGTRGLTFSAGDGTADATMTFTGTIADINAALEGATFVATPGFIGTASVQIVTNDQGNTGTGGALSDTDSLAIMVQTPDQNLWLTFANDQAGTGNSDIPNITAGDVVTFGDITQLEISNSNPLASTTSGTLAYGFNLDTVLLSGGGAASDGNTIVNAVHYVGRDIQVGSNNIQLRAGDMLLSTDADETIGGVTYNNDDVFVFRPDTAGDYSQGSFFLLIDGNAASLGLNNITGISLVEQTTVVGGVTLNAGEFLFAHDGSAGNILRYVPGSLGATTTGTASVLIAGADIDIGQSIGGLHLVQADTVIGGRSLTAGQLLVSIQGSDAAVGDTPTINVLRQDLFVLNVTATGTGSTAATASRFFEGLDENLDNNNEAIWGIGYQGNNEPTMNSDTFTVDENSTNGSVVGSAVAADPELGALRYAITAGNTDGAFTVDPVTGQITVANSAVLDFETTPTFVLTVAAIDPEGAYDTATITVNLNDLVENTAPTTSGIADFSVNEDGGFSFIDLKAIFDDTEDADSALVYTIENNTNPGLFDATTINGSGVLTLDYAADQNGTADITLRATDTGGLFVETTFTVTVNAVNDVPTVSNLVGDVLNYAEGDGAVVIEQGSDALVSDIDSIDFDGGTLNVECDSGLQAAEDVFSIRNQGTVAGQIGISGSNVTYGGVVIGTYSGGTGLAPLYIVFNANATSAAVTALVQNITYENANTDNPTAGARSVVFDITDGDGGATLTQNLTVNVAAINDTPLVDLDGTNDVGTGFAVTFTEDGSAVAVADVDAVVSDVDSISFQGLSVSIFGAVDGTNELFTVGGHTFFYGVSDVVSRTVGGTTFEIDYDGTGFNIVREFGGLIPEADMELLIRSMTYENTSQDPTAGNRTMQFVAVDDLGAPGPASSSVITVTAVNDAAVITSNGGGATASVNLTENTTAVTTVTATDAELDTLIYSISGGADAALFTINASTGALSFISAPDFENPADVGTDNVYNVTVQVSDGNGGVDSQTITVNVIDMADGIRVTPIDVVPLGSETLVNTSTTDNQQIGASTHQGMATDANGNYIVVWSSNLQDGSGWGVYAQRYSADGTAVGSEFLVSTTTTDSQLNPSVAMDAAGNFVITWQSNLQDGDSYGIYAQRYDAAGVAQGAEFLVNTTTTGYQGSPTIAMDADGDFVIAWVANGQDPDASLGIYAQRFDASGVAQGGEFRVNTYTTGTQQITSISMDAAGNFVIIWASLNQDGSNYGIFGQRFDASGVAQGAEFQVNTTTANSQLYHDVVMLPDGRFVVEYQSRNADGSFEVFMQRYAADGAAVGGEIRVNTTTVSSAQQPIGSITADASGNITVVWNSDADGDGTAVVGQRFDWAGNKLGGEFVVNTTTAGNQTFPEVIAQSGGRFIVAWGGNGNGDADGVFMQRYGLATSEEGGSATFQIVLESAPTADVTIPISVSDPTEGMVSVGSVTFTAGDWNIAQTVTITGVQDFTIDGDQVFQVIIGAATSADANFNGLDLADLTILNTELPNQAPSGVPVITGTVTEDQMLTADTSGISDPDGLGAFSYQWLRDGVAIAGATASTYTLGDADVGTQISVQVSYTDVRGSSEGPLVSAQTGPVVNVNDAPVGVPTITGTLRKTRC